MLLFADFDGLNARQVSDLSHDEAGWRLVDFGDMIRRAEVGGPLAAAIFAFREFDALSYDLLPAVRSYTVVDPIFGVVTFVSRGLRSIRWRDRMMTERTSSSPNSFVTSMSTRCGHFCCELPSTMVT